MVTVNILESEMFSFDSTILLLAKMMDHKMTHDIKRLSDRGSKYPHKNQDDFRAGTILELNTKKQSIGSDQKKK